MKKEIYEWLPSPEAQFEQHHRVAPGVEYRVVRPDWERHASPVIFAPGWGTVPESYREFVLALAKDDWGTILVDSPHGVELEEPRGDIMDAELRKALAIQKVLEHEGITNAHGIAHSEGAIYLMWAAILSERIKDVLLMNPAGMLAKDTTSRLATDYSKALIAQALRKNSDPAREQHRDNFLKGKREVLRDLRQSSREVRAMAASNVRQMVKEFRNQGGRVSLIATKGDLVYPADKILEGLDTEDFYSISVFKDPEAGHGAPATTAVPFAKEVSQELASLEELPGREKEEV